MDVMVTQVAEVLPQLTRAVIVRELQRTGSVPLAVHNLLDAPYR